MRDWTTLAVAALLSLVAPTTALQAAEAGVVDWHLPLIGAPRLAAPAEPPAHRFHHTTTSSSTSTAKRSLLFTLTAQHVLAALEPKSGDVVWRRRYPAGHPPARHLSCTSDSLIVLSGEAGSDLASLNATTGAVKWSFTGAPGRQGEALCWEDGLAQDVMWLTEQGIRRIEGATGKILWTWDAPVEHADVQRVFRVDNEKVGLLSVAAANGRSTLAVQIVDARTGRAELSSELATPGTVTSTNSLLVGGTGPGEPSTSLVWVDAGRLQSLKLGARLRQPFTLAKSAPALQLVDVGLASRGIFILLHQDGTAATVACIDGNLERSWEFGDATPASLFAAFVDRVGQAHIGHLSYSASLHLGSLQILSLGASDASPTGMLTGHTFPFDLAAFGAMTSFTFEASPAQDYVVATRAMVSTATGSVQAWEGPHLVWRREESLSDLDMSTLHWAPSADGGSGKPGALASSSFTSRLRRHLTVMSNRLFGRSQLRAAGLAADHEQLVIVGSSRFRTVFALNHAQRGHVAWRVHLPAAGEEWVKPARLVQRKGQSPAASISVVSETSARTFELDALTGRIVNTASTNALVPKGRVELGATSSALSGRLHASAFGLEHPLWALSVAEHERVHAVIFPEQHAIASVGRILGDRSTLMKYLNPNTVVLVVFSPATSSASVQLVDSTSGGLLHKFGPIADINDDSNFSLVFRDNWIIYSYRVAGDAARVTEIVSVELYHPPGDHADSSYPTEGTALLALSRTFFSAQSLTIKAVTSTKLGITSHSAIFVNALQQLVAVPRRMLDPRRTFDKPSKQDQEELLLPYEAALPSDPRWVVSHHAELEGVLRVDSFPGRLESESILFASGLDLFATRISPSRSFDVLSPAFNTVQLVVTITLLSLALGWTQNMVKGRQVRQKWYSS